MAKENMNIVFTVCCTLTAAFVGSIVKKYYISKNTENRFSNFIFNAIGSLVAAVMLLILDGISVPSLFTTLLGLAFGLITALQGITNIAALHCGPMSYTSVIISFSTLLSALSGIMFFGESIGWSQIVGIVLMLVSFTLATKKQDVAKNTNLKWLILCLLAFFATGGIGIIQKVHQSTIYKTESTEFLIIAFASSAIICGVFALFMKKSDKQSATEKDKMNYDKKGILIWFIIMIISGLCVAINNKLNLYLSGVMDSAVFFPIVNGGGLILTTIAAVVLFKEKLTKRQWIGLLLGITSVVLLCNPFV